MATVLSDAQTYVGGLNPKGFWKAFSESERQQMIRDDIRAGTTVTLILTGVIFAGLLIGLIGVTLSL